MKYFNFLNPFKYKALLLGTIVSLLLRLVVSLLLPLPLKILLNQVAGEKSDFAFDYLASYAASEQVFILFICFASLAIIEIIVTYFAGKWGPQYAIRTALNLGKQIVNRIDKVKLNYIEQINSSKLVLVLTRDLRNMETILYEFLEMCCLAIPGIIFIFFWVANVSSELFFIAVGCLILNLLVATKISKTLRIEQRKDRNSWGKWHEELSDRLTNIFTVKSLGINKEEFDQLHNRLDDYSKVRRGLDLAQVRYKSVILFTQNILRAALLFVGGLAVVRKEMTPGDLVLWYTYFRMLRPHLMLITKVLSRVQKTRVSWNYLTSCFDDLKDNEEDISGLEMTNFSAHNNLVFNRLKLKSKSEDAKLFSPLSLEIKSGELICLNGPSGIGKSTLANALLGFVNNYDGEILWNNNELKELNKIKLRRNIGYCPQHTNWLYRTLEENLMIGSLNKNDDKNVEEIYELINRLNLSRLFESSMSLDTVMGDGGRGISGGEKQRLSLIRALLRKDVPLYIFDEPTASLDFDSANEVRKMMLSRAAEGAMIILFSHNRDDWSICHKVIELIPDTDKIKKSSIKASLSKNNSLTNPNNFL